MTTDTTRARSPVSAKRRSNSLSSSIVNASNACESSVDSGGSRSRRTMLEAGDPTAQEVLRGRCADSNRGPLRHERRSPVASGHSRDPPDRDGGERPQTAHVDRRAAAPVRAGSSWRDRRALQRREFAGGIRTAQDQIPLSPSHFEHGLLPELWPGRSCRRSVLPELCHPLARSAEPSEGGSSRPFSSRTSWARPSSQTRGPGAHTPS